MDKDGGEMERKGMKGLGNELLKGWNGEVSDDGVGEMSYKGGGLGR